MDEIDELLSNIDESEDEKYKKTLKNEFKGESDSATGNINERIEEIEGVLSYDLKSVNSSGVNAEPSAEVENELDRNAFESDADKSQEQQTVTPADSIIPHFTVRGTRPWNTKEPYIISVDPQNLRKEKNDLENSFYFTSVKENDGILKNTIREQFLVHLRKPNHTIINDYEQFVYQSITGEVAFLVKYFQLDQELKNLFVYHCGPYVLDKMLTNKFQKYNIGFCYKQVSVNKSVRFFPEEFIKASILNWFEENINTHNLHFDSLQHFNAIKNSIAKKYILDVKKFNQNLEVISSKLAADKKISREKLIALKGDEWFGISAIEVYKRFMERTIFQRI